MKRPALLGLAVAFLVGCQDSQVLTSPVGDEVLLDLNDGSLPGDEGNPDFFFLTPLMPDPSGSGNFEDGQFNADLLPVAKVCEFDAAVANPNTCAAVTGGLLPMEVDPVGEQYQVNWKTKDSELMEDDEQYRILVFAGENINPDAGEGEPSRLLGYRDVEPVGKKGKVPRNVTDEPFYVFRDGSNIPIKVRIEDFALCPITRNCETKVVGEDDTQFSLDDGAILFDIPGGQGFSGTLTLLPCVDGDAAVDGLIDLPTFGPCLESETDFTLVEPLEFPATISLCDLSNFSEILALSVSQQEQLTLYHFGGDGRIDALPEASNCPETFASVPSNPLLRFARAIGDRIVNFGSPRPLQAAVMRRINRGGGGDTDELESQFKLVLPGKIEFVTPEDRGPVLVGSPLLSKVQVTDLKGLGIAFATVNFDVAGSPTGGATTAPPQTSPVAIDTDINGFAEVTWTLGTSHGDYELIASGRGIADPLNNGPRDGRYPDGEFDPFIPIQWDELAGDGIDSQSDEQPVAIPVPSIVPPLVPDPATRITFKALGAVPDLTVSSLTHDPASPFTFETITFTAVVKNDPTSLVAAPPSTLMFKIGGETPGIAATLFAVPELAPGATFTQVRAQELNIARAYQNTATADFPGVVPESDNDNNTTIDIFVVKALLFGTEPGAGNLLEISATTGAGTLVGVMGVTSVPSLATDLVTGQLFMGSGSGSPNLYTVSETTGTATLVGSSGLGFAAIGGMDFRRSNGVLYAAVNIAGDGGTGSDHLATINTTTGVATLIGSFGTCTGVPALPVDGSGSCTLEGIEGIAFDGMGVLWGSLSARGAAGAPGLYTIDLATGAATFATAITDGSGNPPSGGVVSLEFASNGTLFGGTARAISPATDGGFLITIDPTTGLFSKVGTTAATASGRSLAGLAIR